jgi:hypothetical protein
MCWLVPWSYEPIWLSLNSFCFLLNVKVDQYLIFSSWIIFRFAS